MDKPEIRLSQIVMSFGPGALVDLPDRSVIMAGLEHWKYDPETLAQSAIEEPRLIEKVETWLENAGVNFARPLRLRTPPPMSDDEHNTFNRVKGFVFPQWFISKETEMREGRQARRLAHRDRLDKNLKMEGYVLPFNPVRVVQSCPNGHISDIDWRALAHSSTGGARCPAGQLTWEEEGTSGDISRVRIACSCGAFRPLGDVLLTGAGNVSLLGLCNGDRPWLGPRKRENCGVPLRMLNRSATNAYFPVSISVISIPEADDPVMAKVIEHWADLADIKEFDDLKVVLRVSPRLKVAFEGIKVELVFEAIRQKQGAAPKQVVMVKEAEFKALSNVRPEQITDKPDGIFFATELKKESWQGPLMKGISKVVLVHRLREVMAQVGFTRLEGMSNNTNGEMDLSIKPAMLASSIEWLPAVENRGEGIFLEFDSAVIKAWAAQDAVKKRANTLYLGFQEWKRDHNSSTRNFEGVEYYMLHSLSHMLLSSLALECGYPLSSLRERVYAMDGKYGILIYTGSSDAEGTLGGLIDAGRRISRHLQRALRDAKLCSNDPVCSHHDPVKKGGQYLSGSACHGCLLVPETSCEQFNNLLDRSLVVPTLESSDAAFFKI